MTAVLPKSIQWVSPTSHSPDQRANPRKTSPQNVWLWRPGCLLSGEPDGCGKQRHRSQKAHTKFHMLWGPGQRQQFERNLHQTHLLILESLPQRQEAVELTLGPQETGIGHSEALVPPYEHWCWWGPLWSPPSSWLDPRPRPATSPSASVLSLSPNTWPGGETVPPTVRHNAQRLEPTATPEYYTVHQRAQHLAPHTRAPALIPGPPGPCKQRPRTQLCLPVFWNQPQDLLTPGPTWQWTSTNLRANFTHQWTSRPLGPGLTHQWADTSSRTTTGLQPTMTGPSAPTSRLTPAPGSPGPRPHPGSETPWIPQSANQISTPPTNGPNQALEHPGPCSWLSQGAAPPTSRPAAAKSRTPRVLHPEISRHSSTHQMS